MNDRPLHLLSLAPKRYVLLRPLPEGGWEVVGGTEHALGGGVVDPPTLSGRDVERRHRWTYPVAAPAGTPAEGCDALLKAPGDEGHAQPFPVLRRFQAATPETLRRVPRVLGAHPFAPLVQG